MSRIAVPRVNGILEVDRIEFQGLGILYQWPIRPTQGANGIGVEPQREGSHDRYGTARGVGAASARHPTRRRRQCPHLTVAESWGLIGLASSNGISEGFEGQFHLVCFTAN